MKSVVFELSSVRRFRFFRASLSRRLPGVCAIDVSRSLTHSVFRAQTRMLMATKSDPKVEVPPEFDSLRR